MQAKENKFEEFLQTPKTQFVIPVYQRNYDWTLTQCKQLLDDIIQAGSTDDISAHFIGSIVNVQAGIYASSALKELIIIDGQQRITTIILIYLAIYHLAEKIGDENLRNEINEYYLINKFATNENEKLKLKPTENNDNAYRFLVRNPDDEDFTEYSRLIENFEYFRKRINNENYTVVLKRLSKLMIVDIALDRDKDNPQRIFESLNSTGLELSQADLIRNYILMGLSRVEQEKIYKNYWEVIEKYAKDEAMNKSRVSDLIRDFLTVENKRIPNKNKVYIEYKQKYPTQSAQELETNLNLIKGLAKYYNKLINPINEENVSLRKELEYINQLEIDVAYPFLVRVYSDYGSQKINLDTFYNILQLVQNYVWRRFVVGLPTNALNKIFMNLYDKIDPENYLFSIQKSLLQRGGAHRFPTDSEVIDALRIKDVFNIKQKNRTYLFEKLENYENKEIVKIGDDSEITVEHIFPQKPDAKWVRELGHDACNEIKVNYLHTISNLTLTGYNSKLSNKYFTEKRDATDFGYKNSRLWLNKYIANLDRWDIPAMKKRFDILAKRFLKVWSRPDIVINDDSDYEINIFEASEPRNKRLAYAIFMEQKLSVTKVTDLYIEILLRLFELEPERFFTTQLAEKLSLSKRSGSQSLRAPLALNDQYVVESNIDSNNKFARIKLALEIFELEDELFIKYAE